MNYERFDIVVVPFPFTDSATTKKRPALVISSAKGFNLPAGHSVMAMITSTGNPAWPLDVEITDRNAAGLTAASLVRMKLFTLDNRFILRRLGQLSTTDRKTVATALKTLLA
ncbi:MAG: type II toxin-antitoxin system PemK/MazF family toxin [Candidatus Binatia bacterium]|nr:type II toxin-antitoxin system PemK/MazF family toxin [Candidatus Binatia bacterium]